MAWELGQDRTGQESNHPGRWLARLPAIERPMLLLRWLALLLVIVLHLFDRSTSGVLLPVPAMVLIVAGYNVLLLILMRYVRWLQQPLNYLAIDTAVSTLAVYLTGGYHSSFFVLYVFITIGAAFQLELARTIVVALGIGLIYVGACYLSPAGLESPYAQYILAAKLFLLLVVAVLCGLLLEQLRREHQETERERALAGRLKALNDLFQELNTTLDLDHTLQIVAQAPKDLLDADFTSIALLDDGGEWLSIAAAAGMDAALFSGQHWSADDDQILQLVFSGQPHVADEAQLVESRRHYASLLSESALPRLASVVSIPLMLNDKPLGVLDVAFSKRRAFTDEDLAFLQGLGQEAALAIRNARTYEWERDQVTRLRALDKLQESFVSSVSHELRTPLTCIRTSTDLLAATSARFSEDQKELVRTIGHHVGRLEGLVADLLEITKLEAGQVVLSKQPSDLRPIAERVVETLRPLTVRKGQAVELSLPEQASPVDIDRRRIEQVLTNILSNAIKFTPKRGHIRVSVLEVWEGVQVCVSDDGPGIAEDDQTRVFDKFYVVTDDRGLSGVGLGLYIARQMIELHGGRIWVESQIEEGSTFCFELPKMSEEGAP